MQARLGHRRRQARKPEATERQREWSWLCNKWQTSTDCRTHQDPGGLLMGSIVANYGPSKQETNCKLF